MQNFSYDLSSPAEAVFGSTRSYLFATGIMNLCTRVEKVFKYLLTGLLPGRVVALEGLEDLLLQPSGSGEQTVVKFCTNVIVLLYLNRTDQLNNRLLMNAVSNIRHGITKLFLRIY